jgi:hypothetical protein
MYACARLCVWSMHIHLVTLLHYTTNHHTPHLAPATGSTTDATAGAGVDMNDDSSANAGVGSGAGETDAAEGTGLCVVCV